MDKREENLAKIRQLGEKVRIGSGYQHTIAVHYEDGVGNTYEGNIVVRRPNLRDYMTIGALKAKFLLTDGENPVHPAFVELDFQKIAEAVATLSTVVESCPSWFSNLEEMEDVDLLLDVYERFLQWVGTFRKSVPTEPTENIEG